MKEDQDRQLWQDPLLITDACTHQQQKTIYDPPHRSIPELPTSRASTMENQEDSLRSPTILEESILGNQNDPVANNVDRDLESSMVGFSLSSPDIVMCFGVESPDIPTRGYGYSPEFFKGGSIEVSLENGINGPEAVADCHIETPDVTLKWQVTEKANVLTETSFELLPQPVIELNPLENHTLMIGVNAGSSHSINSPGGLQFMEDCYFIGGDTIRTNAIIGDGEGHDLYQTARYGNFTYHFRSVESGCYIVDLHFSEIVFTDGPPGMRVFDVFIQQQKVVQCLDIYARVGGNMPLVISDLKSQVNGEEGLSVRFEGVNGSPIVCGISVRKDSSSSFKEVQSLNAVGASLKSNGILLNGRGDTDSDGEFERLQLENVRQKLELTEARSVLEELKKDNEQKSRECQEAWKSLKELQNELMRKSMHVGSLAFAIEGQVKEKSRWFSLLRDLTRRLKILKMDHIKLFEEALSYKQCLEDMKTLSSMVELRMKQQSELHEDLKVKFIQGAKERKELYNKVQELKGNIRVFCRCRPLNNEEISAGASVAVNFDAANDGELTVISNGNPKKTFKFDAVFGPQADQRDVFEDTAPFAASVLDGYNVCIFAYGQTGTGKTFTMEGSEASRGVNYRTLDELFRIIEERTSTVQYEISVSVLEVYNEQIRDLLVSGSQTGVTARRLEIKQVGEGVHHIPGLVEARVSNTEEAWEVLLTGSNGRAVGSTNANEHSSRSHCIHCVMVKGENLLNGECTRSKLWLVDLAGSERIAKSEVQGERLKETQNINRSLSALGDVISALATKSQHIPFRNSKLTHLLQDSLGGDSKTLMFVQISPSEHDLNETLCSLNFASRVRGIELGPPKKQIDSSELLRYKQMVEKTKLEMKSKDFQIRKMEDTIHGLEIRTKEKDLKSKNLQDKIKELESQLLVERKLARQHVDTKIAEQHQHLRQQQEEQSLAVTRPPLATRPIVTYKTSNENKEPVNLTRPFTENNNKLATTPIPSDTFLKRNDTKEKENNPDIPELSQIPKRTGRASICTTAQPIQARAAPRRNSLIPLPTLPAVTKLPSSLLPMAPIQSDEKEEIEGIEDKCLPEPTPWDSPKDQKMGSKKLGSILRRSLQKRIQMKPTMHPHTRRVGLNVGMEKVRISIGSRGRMAHRALGNARRLTKDMQQKQGHKEREKGWNVGTAAARNIL